MAKSKAEVLIEKYNKGACTPQEKELVETWFLEATKDQEDRFPDPDYGTLKAELWAAIQQRTKRQIRPLWPRFAAAASVILCLSFGTYFYLQQGQHQKEARLSQAHDRAPGSSKATLTLANGQKIPLDSSSPEKIVQQANATVNITSGSVRYALRKGNAELPPTYNTLTTKNGEEYPLVLADGTKVWLNSASSITYPVAFSGHERKVVITGEVYFEVVHNAAQPFRVAVKDQIIEDLGTHFNINAYEDELTIKATLLEGSIKISNNAQSVVLKPGQQAAINSRKPSINLVDNADTEAAIAWHKGLFHFRDADIPTLMRQLARWYDVEVTYEGTPPSRRFSGKIYRNVSALKVSDILKYNDIHFRIEGKKIIVMP